MEDKIPNVSEKTLSSLLTAAGFTPLPKSFVREPGLWPGETSYRMEATGAEGVTLTGNRAGNDAHFTLVYSAEADRPRARELRRLFPWRLNLRTVDYDRRLVLAHVFRDNREIPADTVDAVFALLVARGIINEDGLSL